MQRYNKKIKFLQILANSCKTCKNLQEFATKKIYIQTFQTIPSLFACIDSSNKIIKKILAEISKKK